MRKSKYTKEFLEEYVKISKSFSDLVRKILKQEKVHGGSIDYIKNKLIEHGIDYSHFQGRGWFLINGGTLPCYRITEETLKSEYLTEQPIKRTNSHNLKLNLYKFNLRTEQCERCKIVEWNGKKLSFHLEHINGNSLDNRLENLEILCPNCHSQTSTYAGKKNIKKEKQVKVLKEAKVLKEPRVIKPKRQKETSDERSLRLASNRKVKDRPSVEQIAKEVKELGYSGTGRKYGVSDNTIRKWIK